MEKRPIPKRGGKKSVYDLDALEIGASFSVPIISAMALYRATQYHARKTGRKYTCREEGKMYTTWRVK